MEAGSGALQEAGPVKRAVRCYRTLHDEAAASDLATDEAFGLQEFVGGGHGGAIQSK